MELKFFYIKAINFSAYGASFVHIDEEGNTVTPLYNYLKPYPPQLSAMFYKNYDGEGALSKATASPVLGSLNSGMQLFRLQQEKPDLFNKIQYSLHLPQYISYLITGKAFAEITSIGCHTGLWDFEKKRYHNWVLATGIIKKFPVIFPSDKAIDILVHGCKIKAGIGLHDSSAALIPYLACFLEPFILLSTGTWCISFNPFNKDPLTVNELQQDCLCYIEYGGSPVKASRLFSGHEHEEQVIKLAGHFRVAVNYYMQVPFTPALLKYVQADSEPVKEAGLHISAFAERDLNKFSTYELAYHQLIYDIIQQQALSTSLVLSAKKVTRIFVDGGFAKNHVYMNLLAKAFPGMEVFAASVSQASAIGAALAIHSDWSTKPVPGDMVELKYFS
jgi:sugar (pentulose or hexulose) kinase